MDSGIERYIETSAGNKSVFVVKLDNKLSFLVELVMQQERSVEFSWGWICIPSYVLLLILENLCQRHIDAKKATAALNKLFVSVQ